MSDDVCTCSLVIGLSVALGLLILEFVGFLGGFSMFLPSQGLICILYLQHLFTQCNSILSVQWGAILWLVQHYEYLSCQIYNPKQCIVKNFGGSNKNVSECSLFNPA